MKPSRVRSQNRRRARKWRAQADAWHHAEPVAGYPRGKFEREESVRGLRATIGRVAFERRTYPKSRFVGRGAR